MAQPILLKRSSIGGNAPTIEQLQLGEVAINTYDGTIYIKKDTTATGGGESIIEFGGAAPSDAKADKVINAVAGNLAGLDEDGNLTDSGNAPTDFAALLHAHEISEVTGLQSALDGKLGVSENAVSASVWQTARTITLDGGATGSVEFDGSDDFTLTMSIVDDSHNHIIANVDGLQVQLDSKLGTSENAVSASQWETPRTITLGGDATGSVAFDGSADFTLNVVVGDDSHDHIIANVDGLQDALDSKLDNTGNAPTASAWETPRTITLGGDATGSVAFDGSADFTLNVGVVDDSHSHVIDNVDGLQTELDTLQTNIDGKLGQGENAVSASKWETPRTLTVDGGATGSVVFDGSDDISLTVAIADDSHDHTIANVDGLQDALDSKLDATANAVSATKWETARTISLSGDASGSVILDGTGDVTITTTVADDSHDHTIANVDGLQSALNTKLGVLENAVSASQWATEMKLDVTGDVTGSVSFDGSEGATGVTLTATVAENSHGHTIANVDGLQTALDGKLGVSENAVSASQWLDSRLITLAGDATGSVSMSGAEDVTLTVSVNNNSHEHTIGNVSGLQTALDAKLDATANAVSASQWADVIELSLGGDLTGSVEFDGSGNVVLSAQVANNSHNHTIANVSGLQTALDGKLGVAENAVSASQWLIARTIGLTGDVSGSVSWDGSGDVAMVTTVADDSHNHTIANVDGLQSALDTKVNNSSVGVANGVATLDGTGKLTSSEIPDSLLGGLTYQGQWDADQNVPPLVSSNGSQGHYYRVSVAGTTNLDGISDWDVRDWAVFNGTVWEKVDNSALVVSVSGRTGAIVLTESDINGLDKYSQAEVNSLVSNKLNSNADDTFSGSTLTMSAGSASILFSSSAGPKGMDFSNGSIGSGEWYVGQRTSNNEFVIENNLSDGTPSKVLNIEDGIVTDAEFQILDRILTVDGDRVFDDGYHPNADRWTTARTLSLTGDVTGSVSMTGAGNMSLSTTVANNSHNHTIANITNLQTTLDGKLSTTGKAADSQLLDGIDSSAFLRSNATDTFTTLSGTSLTANTLIVGTSNKIQFANNDYLRFDDTSNTFHFDIDAGTSNGIVKAATFQGALSGNASTASKWATARTLSLTGDVTGSTTIDGSGNASITTVVGNNSHTHTIANVTGLQTALDGKLSTTGKAADSDKLDNLNSSQFVRSDADDTKTGYLQMQDNAYLRLGSGADVEHFWNGTHYYTDINGGANWYLRDGDTSNATRFTFDIDTGNLTATTFTGALAGNATTATSATSAGKWTTARTLSLTGDVTGSTTIDGSGNASITTVVGNDSHNHTHSDGAFTVNGVLDIRHTNVQVKLTDTTYDNKYWMFDHQNGDLAFRYNSTTASSMILTEEGVLQGTFSGPLSGNATTATTATSAGKWTTARTLSLTGDVTGSVSWSGSANASITAVVTNDSHTHDGRYYTEAESNSLFANVSGDTFTGDVQFNEEIVLNNSGETKGIRWSGGTPGSDAAGIRWMGVTNAGYLELWTTDDWAEPFVFRSYDTGSTGTGNYREWAKIDNNGIHALGTTLSLGSGTTTNTAPETAAKAQIKYDSASSSIDFIFK